MKQVLIKSNCLIEAVKLKLDNPYGKIRWDRNCPSGGISFYFDHYGVRYRFRRKIRRHSNKGGIVFWGYRVTETIEQ